MVRYKNDCFAIQKPTERYQRKLPLLSFFLAVTFHWNSCNVFLIASWHLTTTPDFLLPLDLCCRGHQKYENKPDLHFVWRYDSKDSFIKIFSEDPINVIRHTSSIIPISSTFFLSTCVRSYGCQKAICSICRSGFVPPQTERGLAAID